MNVYTTYKREKSATFRATFPRWRHDEPRQTNLLHHLLMRRYDDTKPAIWKKFENMNMVMFNALFLKNLSLTTGFFSWNSQRRSLIYIFRKKIPWSTISFLVIGDQIQPFFNSFPDTIVNKKISARREFWKSPARLILRWKLVLCRLFHTIPIYIVCHYCCLF